MRNHHLPGVRVFSHLVFVVALAFAPAFVNGQAVTLVQSGARFAGSGASGFNTDFGSATTVDLTPSNLVFDSLGNQYVSDAANNCVRKITPTGSISTIVGLAVGGSGDTCNILTTAPPLPPKVSTNPLASPSTAPTTSSSPTANTTASANSPTVILV